MIRALRRHMTPSMAVSILALVVALGGTTYAATGGTFTLGQANFAGSQTSLSSSSSASALHVSNTKSGQGVYGHSSGNAGVVGDSKSFDGVFGTSHGIAAGVSGHNDAGGWGVWAAGGDAAKGTDAIFGTSAASNGVHGEATSNVGSGVYGHNGSAGGTGVAGRAESGNGVWGDTASGIGVLGSSGSGTGVSASSASGWALHTTGNAAQQLNDAGFVKAVAYVNPINSSDPIQQCFNSQLPPQQATTGNCGLTYSSTAGPCDSSGCYVIDFGFSLSGRFLSVSAARTTGVLDKIAEVGVGPTSTSATVTMYDVGEGQFDTSAFYIFVY